MKPEHEIIDECETKYIAHTEGSRTVLSVNKHYDDLTAEERAAHHKFNEMMGVRKINDPPRLGEQYSITLKSNWERSFEIGQTYTPREIVDVSKQLFEEVKQAITHLFESWKQMAGALSDISNGYESETCEVSIISPDGYLWEADDGYYVESDNYPFYVNVDGDDAPDVEEHDATGWEIVCSSDGDVIFSGVVEQWHIDEFEDENGEQLIVEYDCVPDSEWKGEVTSD